MSKFFDIDDWEPVDMAATGMGIAAGVAAPLTIGFSIFMAGEAATPAYDANTGESDMPAAKCTKKTPTNNLFIGMSAPKPTWAN